ncbi:MAG: YigZ family protein [Desulfuromonas sp.]|nr:MAG: YigZ family protein [Desulfuromonas sp.]
MTSGRYPIPAGRFRCEIEVQRSRFIATVQPVTSSREAQAFVAAVKTEFPDANHNCWAYLLGPPGSSDQVGLSDDGEPHGVAGRPMLTALQYGGLGDLAVVVTRFFGGTKLGKGGMVKAYTAAVQAALQQLPRGERVDWSVLLLTLDYSLLTLLQRCLEDFEAEMLDISYAELVSCRLRLPLEREDAFRKMLDDLGSGSVGVEKG